MRPVIEGQILDNLYNQNYKINLTFTQPPFFPTLALPFFVATPFPFLSLNGSYVRVILTGCVTTFTSYNSRYIRWLISIKISVRECFNLVNIYTSKCTEIFSIYSGMFANIMKAILITLIHNMADNQKQIVMQQCPHLGPHLHYCRDGGPDKSHHHPSHRDFPISFFNQN